MLSEKQGSLPLIVTSSDRMDIVLGLLAAQVKPDTSERCSCNWPTSAAKSDAFKSCCLPLVHAALGQGSCCGRCAADPRWLKLPRSPLRQVSRTPALPGSGYCSTGSC